MDTIQDHLDAIAAREAELREQFAALRTEHGAMLAVCRAADVQQANVSQWLAGTRNLRADVLARIEAALSESTPTSTPKKSAKKLSGNAK